MKAEAKLWGLGAVLIVVAVAVWAALSGPSSPAASGHGGHEQRQASPFAGLTSSQDGYTLAPVSETVASGPFLYRILGPDGRAVTAFDVESDKLMHLIVVRRDTSGFRHVHPVMAADGTWSVPLEVGQAGTYRVFADFKPTGAKAITLGADFTVAGEFEPKTYPESRVAEVDGYQVRLDGDLAAGKATRIRATVSRDGKPVTDLQPYLGAYGHLVALRQSDLAYLHIHPRKDGKSGPEIAFVTVPPSEGGYRLFLDFQHNGVVHTVEFTVIASR
ncbi:hypothetical protein [Actinokineospora sp. HUAS TT18]|uniref:hypothetical protein n=1 Tax=Actinokineospora sp. HUAS TT18 TaxID=3447451 RepID=UPI003F52121E